MSKKSCMINVKRHTLCLFVLYSFGITNLGFSAETLKSNPMEKAIAGHRYESMVPDTLDLADRMALAINCLSNYWIPEEKWAINHLVDFSRKPASIFPNVNISLTDAYLNLPPKALEALALCRLGSGSSQNMDVDWQVLNSQLEHQIGDDGLLYSPLETLPDFKGDRPHSSVWGEGRHLLALSMLAQIDDNPLWVKIGKRKVDRMLAMTTQKEGFRFIWKSEYQPDDKPPVDPDEPVGFTPLYVGGALGHGAALFYRVTGYEPALELSRGLAHWLLKRVYKNEDGRYKVHHFHHSLYALMAVCEYGIAANDREVLERVDACYRWARTQGEPLIGYYTEAMPGSEWYLSRSGNTVETCEVADMLWLAMKLTQAGLGDYWDDLDCWIRNVFAEAQYRDPGVIERIPDEYFRDEPLHAPHQDTRNVTQRVVGGFFGWMRVNDGLPVDQTEQGPRIVGEFSPSQRLSIMVCCCGNGSRALYYIWDSIVQKDNEVVNVNLLLNRASKWLDMDSFLPVEGKVVLHIKDAPQVAVRMPQWCDAKQVLVKIKDKICKTKINGQFVHITMLKPGDDVTIHFNLPTRVVHKVIGEIPYKLTIRGSNVIAIDPKGLAYPLYQNQPTGKLIKKTRFLPKISHVIW